MSSLQQRIVDIAETTNQIGKTIDVDHRWNPTSLPLFSAGRLAGATPTVGLKAQLFRVTFVVALVSAMTGWIYALGWLALKLIV